MDQNLNISIFNPNDKQKEKTRYYLGYVPKDMKTIVKKIIVYTILIIIDGIQLMRIIK